jgi:hypothetical protein
MPEDNHQHISVVPPLLRQDVLQQESKPGDYIHGYMLNAGFSENILNWHKKHPDTPLRFFWDHWEEEPVKKIDSTLSFYQLRVSSPDGRLQGIRQHGRIRIGVRSHVFRKTHPDGTGTY